jgi:hypothetical protein
VPEGDPPPCPKCASIAVTATQYPDDHVVWFLCHRCKHTWCELVNGELPKVEKRTGGDAS